MSKKTSVYISDRAEAVFGVIPEGASLSGRLNAVADRYGELIARARRGVLSRISAEELSAIRTACAGWATRTEPAGVLIGGISAELADASLPDGELEGQDIAGLIEKMGTLSPVEELALIEWLESRA